MTNQNHPSEIQKQARPSLLRRICRAIARAERRAWQAEDAGALVVGVAFFCFLIGEAWSTLTRRATEIEEGENGHDALRGCHASAASSD